MNFRLTLLKGIVSALTAAFVGYFSFGFYAKGGNCFENINTGEIMCTYNWFLPKVIISSLILGIIIYSVWSLVQKKKR
jgi:hypothetical protein